MLRQFFVAAAILTLSSSAFAQLRTAVPGAATGGDCVQCVSVQSGSVQSESVQSGCVQCGCVQCSGVQSGGLKNIGQAQNGLDLAPVTPAPNTQLEVQPSEPR